MLQLMTDEQRDSLIVFDDSRRRGPSDSQAISNWPVLAVMAIGVILALSGLLGLLVGDRVDSFGSFGGNALAGVHLASLGLGIGLVMRNDLARRVYLVFAIAGLVLTVISPSSYSSSFASYLLGVALDVVTVALLVHPSVKRAFD